MFRAIGLMELVNGVTFTLLAVVIAFSGWKTAAAIISCYGITLAVDHHRVGPVSLALDYTWLRALGNSSDPNETATRAAAGEDPRPRLIPFNWDQRHTLNITAALSKPGNYSISTIIKAASGQPYTPVLESGFGLEEVVRR